MTGVGVLKGQMVFEFIIATLFFLAIVMYTINYINITASGYSDDHYRNMIESNVWQVSEVLVRSPGVWNSGVPETVGLAEEWPVLDEQKIADLDTWCPGNQEVLFRLLDVDPEFNGIKLYVTKLGPSEETLLDCGWLPTTTERAVISRYGVSNLDGSVLRINVTYW
jgi:hypothetical protein